MSSSNHEDQKISGTPVVILTAKPHNLDMSRPPLKIVIARAQNGVIGCDNRLPWHLPEDLKRFRKLTDGTAMIMGRKTFESLPGLLPGRRHIVLTRNANWQAAGAEIAYGVKGAIALLKGCPGSVIGGAEIFELFLPIVDRIELTEIFAKPNGDTRISDPRSRESEFEQTIVHEVPKGDGKPRYQFWSLVRRQNDFQEKLLNCASAT